MGLGKRSEGRRHHAGATIKRRMYGGKERRTLSGVDTIVPVLVCHECCIYMELVRQWTGITIITLNYGVMMVVDLCLDDGVDTGHH